MIRKYFACRSLGGSDSVILMAIALHLYEGVVFLTTNTANGAIGMHALLLSARTFGGDQISIGVWLVVSCALAVVGQWGRGLRAWHRIVLLMPQETLLIITSLAAVFAVLAGHYADGVVRSYQFISTDQFIRIAEPLVYGPAMFARARNR